MDNQNLKLRDQVLSEVDLLELFNIGQPTLDKLGLDKGFPYIRLDAKRRVYLSGDVYKWLCQQML